MSKLDDTARIQQWLGHKEVPTTPDAKRPWEIVYRYPALTDADAMAALRKAVKEFQPGAWMLSNIFVWDSPQDPAQEIFKFVLAVIP